MRHYLFQSIAACAIALLGCATVAQAAPPDGPIMFTNVNVFDGVSDKLIRNANVVVTGNKITAVSTEDLAVIGGRVIDGGGRTLMPGLADTHVHLAFASSSQAQTFTGNYEYNIINRTSVWLPGRIRVWG